MALLGWRYGDAWDRMAELADLQSELNRWFSDWGIGRSTNRFPSVNAWVSDDDVIIDAELPGVEAKDVDISLVNNVLTISGTREPEAVKSKETYHRRERRYGRFARSLELPFRVDSGKVKASFRNGILRISLPRAETDKPKKIAIQAG